MNHMIRANVAPATSVRTTFYSPFKIKTVVERLWSVAGHEGAAPAVPDLETFQKNVPCLSGQDYAALARRAYANRGGAPVYIGGSSGTTGPSKLVMSRILPPGIRHSDEDKLLIHRIRSAGLIRRSDVFLNLFMVGNFSILHHGMNSILQACQATILPNGARAADMTGPALDLIESCGVNGLTGTPATIAQFAIALSEAGKTLPIRSILYTGEAFGGAKRKLVQEIFPHARITGFYGLSEAGFLGIETTSAGIYHVRSDAYFLELDPQDRLLVTCLDPHLPVPIVRYMTGDRVTVAKSGRDILLSGIARTGRDFNFMGNIIDTDDVRSAIGMASGMTDPDIEIRLTADSFGRDIMRVGVFGLSDDAGAIIACHNALLALPALSEAADKGQDIHVEPRGFETLATTDRHKQRLVIDDRA
ncbi:hypothetical protein AAC691_17060 [Nguyenibacter vanlangensis]|uniref:Phenylacetate-CoA ligase n=1 Tax=Nguyenibacter vanlangensis TaxID=1216886 RepID=A0ABZ3D311_9PROT